MALLASLDGLREQANENTEDIAEAARRIVERARENLAAASTPEAFNRFVDGFVGPIEKTPQGIVKRQMPLSEDKGTVQRSVAGGGFEPPTSGL